MDSPELPLVLPKPFGATRERMKIFLPPYAVSWDLQHLGATSDESYSNAQSDNSSLKPPFETGPGAGGMFSSPRA
jgi:hypothetical protein